MENYVHHAFQQHYKAQSDSQYKRNRRQPSRGENILPQHSGRNVISTHFLRIFHAGMYNVSIIT